MTVRAPFAALVGIVQMNGTFVVEPEKLSLSHVKSGIPSTRVDGRLVPMTVTLTTVVVLFVAVRGDSDMGFGAPIDPLHDAVVPPFAPPHVQLQGPAPLTADTKPTVHKIAVNVLVN